jgi:hypothetical protein
MRPKAALGVELADPSVCLASVGLHVAPPLALVIHYPASGRPERVAQRYVRIFVRLISRMCPPDRDLRTRQGDVDVEIVQPALSLVMRGRLKNDFAPHDLVAEPLEPRGELTDARLEGR